MSTPEELARKYMSPRAIELDALDAYIKGTQYEGRVDWFDGASETPIFERKPCINYPIAKSAIGAHVAFVLGEGRWPTMTSATSEDDRELDDEWGLSEDDSAMVDRFVNVVLCRYARLKKVAREMLGEAMGCRSVAVIVCVKGGRLCADTVRASWCSPTLNELGECTRLEIQYPYVETFYNDQASRWDRRCMLYRRVIDELSDTVYVPAQALETGRPPVWTVDKKKSREHGLGFCPVLWYPFMRPAAVANTVDGVALHEHQLREIDGLNIALSQKQRAAVTAGDPQLVETGVADGVNPGPMGVTARPQVDIQGVGPDGKPMGVFASVPGGGRRGRRAARKRGAGAMWSYPDKDTKVQYLTIPGDALKAVDDHAKDTRDKIAESLHAVFISPSELKMHAALSGKALSFLFATQLSFDDQVRDDFGDGGLLPLVSMLLRVVYVVGKRDPRKLYIPGVKKLVPVLERFEVDLETDGGELSGKAWMPPRMESVWGPYFAPNEQDQLAVVQLVVQAFQAKVITRQMAIEKLASSGVFEVGSAAEVVDAIVAEMDEEREKSGASLQDAMQTLHQSGIGTGGDDEGGGADDQGPSQGSGGRGARGPGGARKRKPPPKGGAASGDSEPFRATG